VGLFTSLQVDSSDRIHISYYDGNNADLKYAIYASDVWQIATIDSQDNVGTRSGLNVDSDKKVHIGYYKYTTDVVKHVALCP